MCPLLMPMRGRHWLGVRSAIGWFVVLSTLTPSGDSTMSELLESAFAEAKGRISFNPRPAAIPGDLRLSWRVSAVVLVLNRCRAKTASLEQIHFLMWAIGSRTGRDIGRRWFAGVRKPDDPIVRFDPAVSRTLLLAVATGLSYWKTPHSICLTDAGRELASAIGAAVNVMSEEKDFLGALPPNISQKAVRDVLEW